MSGEEYKMGADTAEGIGADYNVASVIRVPKGSGADVQVAVWSSNQIDPWTYGLNLNCLGRFYCDAEIAVEVNNFQTARDVLQTYCQYPNLYMEKNRGAQNQHTGRVGFLSNRKTKKELWSIMRRWLDSRLIEIRDRGTAEELKTFNKDDDGKTGAAKNFFDDRLIALMIALFIAHEGDWDETYSNVKLKKILTLENCEYVSRCLGCMALWPVGHPRESRLCPQCGCLRIETGANPRNEQHVVPPPLVDDTFGDLDSYYGGAESA